MPMEATPFEQVEVAEATKCTGDWTFPPLLGAVTVTVAKAAGTAIAKRHTIGKRRFCMKHFSKNWLNCWDLLTAAPWKTPCALSGNALGRLFSGGSWGLCA